MWWVGREMKGIYSGFFFYLEKEINIDLVVVELRYFVCSFFICKVFWLLVWENIYGTNVFSRSNYYYREVFIRNEDKM